MSTPATDLRFGPPNIQPFYQMASPNATDLRFNNPNVVPVFVENAGTNVQNVVAHGAVGDGVTDDTAAILAAVAALTLGDILYFPAPSVKYIISQPIPVVSGCIYMGDGVQTIIKAANGSNMAAMFASQEWLNNVNLAGVNGTVVRDLYFDGNSANNLTGGHGIIIQAWQARVEHCWLHNIPQSAVVVTDKTQNGTLVTNSIVENKLRDLKIDTTGQYGIWVTDFNAQCTDGHIDNCEINSTTSHGMFVERAAGWYLRSNHVYSVKGSGYVLHKCFATTVIGNQIADYANDATLVGTFSGITATCIEGYATIIADNLVISHEIAAATYQHLVVTCDGAAGATSGTFCIVHDNKIRGGWTFGISLDSIAITLTATAQQQANGQTAGILAHDNTADRVHTETSIGAFIQTNMLQSHHLGSGQFDGLLNANQLGCTGGAAALAAGASAGTTPPAPVSTTNRDMRGACTFGTGTAPTAGVMVNVTFNTPFATAPVVVLCAGNAATAPLQVYVTQVTTTGFKIAVAVAPAASQANTTYSVAWMIVG